MASRVLQGDVFDVLPTIERGSIDVAVTSPPYWKLRSYLPKDHPLKALELGSEATPAEYVANMVRVFGLVRECLADHGTLWVNVGDTYCNSGSRNNGTGLDGKRRGGMKDTGGDWATAKESYGDIRHTLGLDTGSLCLIPQRLAIALQDDGWLVRSVVIWHKPSAMPASLSGWMWRRCRVKVGPNEGLKKTAARMALSESTDEGHARQATFKDRYVKGEQLSIWQDCPGCKKCSPNGGLVLRRGSWRPTSSYEPVLLLAKTDRYYCDGIAVQTPAASATLSRDRYTRIAAEGTKSFEGEEGGILSNATLGLCGDHRGPQFAVAHDHETDCGGFANLRDVWTIAAEPLKEKHYAAFPTALVSNCLRAGTSSKGYCRSCGTPWCRVIAGGIFVGDLNPKVAEGVNRTSQDGRAWAQRHAEHPTKTLGWRPSCSCDAGEPRPGRVLDPFAGSGRTGLEAQRLGLDFVGVELNPGYAEMSNRLLREDMPLFFAPDAPAAGREKE